MPTLKAKIGGNWVYVGSPSAGGGGGGGTDEVWIGADEPADPNLELWVDTDAPNLADPNVARWNSAWGVVAHRKNTTTGSPDVGSVGDDVLELGVEFLPVPGRRYRTTVDWLALAQPLKLGIVSGTTVVTTDAAGTATIIFPMTYATPPYSLVVNNGDGGAVNAMMVAPLVINPDRATVLCRWPDGNPLASATLRLNWVAEVAVQAQIIVPVITDGDNVVLQQRNQTMHYQGTYTPVHVEHVDEDLPAVATIRKARWSADLGYVSFVSSVNFPATITVEDIGPVTMSSPPPARPEDDYRPGDVLWQQAIRYRAGVEGADMIYVDMTYSREFRDENVYDFETVATFTVSGIYGTGWRAGYSPSADVYSDNYAAPVPGAGGMVFASQVGDPTAATAPYWTRFRTMGGMHVIPAGGFMTWTMRLGAHDSPGAITWSGQYDVLMQRIVA